MRGKRVDCMGAFGGRVLQEEQQWHLQERSAIPSLHIEFRYSYCSLLNNERLFNCDLGYLDAGKSSKR